MKVTAVDPAKRTVTLVKPDGITHSYELGKSVRNFDQIKVGDEVKATLLEAVAVAVSKSNAPPDASGRDLVAVAPKGAMPGVIMAKTRQIEDCFGGSTGTDGDCGRSSWRDTDHQGGTEC